MRVSTVGIALLSLVATLTSTIASADPSGSIAAQVKAAQKVLNTYNSMRVNGTQLNCAQMNQIFELAYPKGSAVVSWFTPQDSQQAKSIGYTSSDWSTILNANKVVDSVVTTLAASNCERAPNNHKCCKENPLASCPPDPTKNCILTGDGLNCATSSHMC